MTFGGWPGTAWSRISLRMGPWLADQEELIDVVSGTIGHWIEQEQRILGPGDGDFMPPKASSTGV
jgi:uncharacterized cupin superfamily protein